MTLRNLAFIASATLGAVVITVAAVALTIYVPYRQALDAERGELLRALEVQEILLPLLLAERPGSLGSTEYAGASPDEPLGPGRAQFILDSMGAATTFHVLRRVGDEARTVYAQGGGSVRFGRPDSTVSGPLSEVVVGAPGEESGTFTAEDEAGRGILYAYRRLAGSDLVLSAALPLSAIRQPAIHSVVIDSLLWLVTFAVLGLFYYFLNPGGRLPTLRDSVFRSIVESSQDGILVIDRLGDIRFGNPAARRMFGFGALQAGRKRVDDLWVDPDRARRETDIGLFLAGGSPELRPAREAWAVNNEGERFPLSVRAATLEVSNEELLLLNLSDVTEKVQIEQALVEARKAAENAAKDQARLLANISHEIRNPISGVIGMLDLLRITGPGPDREKYLELAHSSAAGVLTLTNEVLDWARIEGGRTACEAIVFEPAELLAEVVESFQVRAHARGIELEWRAGPEVPDRVVGDPGHMKRVLSNLVDNAIKFTEQGSVRLGVDLLEQGDGLTRLCFAVRDTGPGIPREVGERIFEPFQQGDPSTARQHGGTGLGLSICRSLVAMMGGEIGHESAEGGGTRFWLRIALADASAEPDASGVEAIRAATGP